MWPASSSTAAAKRSSSSSDREEADADPQRVEGVDRSGDREDPRSELVERGLGRPAGDPERHQGRHRVRAGSAPSRRGWRPDASPPRPPSRSRGGGRNRARRTSTASRSSGPSRRPTGGGSRCDSNRRASGHHDGIAGQVEALEAAASRRAPGRGRSTARRVDHERAHPLGPEQPLLGRDGVQVGAEGIEADRDRAGRLGAVDDDEGAARVGDVGDPGDRHDGAGRPQDVRDRDEPGVGA